MSLIRGEIVSVSGIDGSGKTTCIEQLRGFYDEKGKPSRYIWLRYNHYITKVLLVFCRLIGLTYYQNIDGARMGYHDFYRSTLLSHLFVWLTLMDTFFISLILVYIPAIFSRSVIICDRWVPDILIDLEIDTHISMVVGTLYEKLFWAMIPSAAHVLVIQRDYDDVFFARTEHKIDKNFKHRFQLYKTLISSSKVKMIDNTGTVEDAVASAIRAVTKKSGN